MSGRLLQLIRLELRLLQRDPGAVLALFILAMAVTYGAANGTSSTEQWSASAGRIVSTERQERVQRIESVRQSTKQGPVLASEAYTDATSPLGAAAKGAAAVLHPTGMSALAVGRTDVRPHAIQISIWRSSTELNKGDFRNPLNMLIGRFDPAFVSFTCFRFSSSRSATESLPTTVTRHLVAGSGHRYFDDVILMLRAGCASS
jgi:hypothetical protein